MAERRMFAKTIIDSDAFLEMPISARLLYYDLSMRADDDGFNNSPRKVMRTVGATTDDLNILIARKFIIPFENGVVVIKHWRIHNYIRRDTYKETPYKEQKAMLEYDENNAYRMTNDGETPLLDEPLSSRGRAVDEPSTQVRLGKDRDRIGKDSIASLPEAETAPDPKVIIPIPSPMVISITLNDKTEHIITEDDVAGWKELYPAVDILQELRKMKGWVDANPTKRKTKTGIKRFINAWLSKEQDRYHGPADSGQQPYQGGGYRNTAPHGADRILEMIDRGDFDE